MAKDKLQLIKDGDTYFVIDGVLCTHAYCKEYGCDFPNCANIVNSFTSIEDVHESYPTLKVIAEFK